MNLNDMEEKLKESLQEDAKKIKIPKNLEPDRIVLSEKRGWKHWNKKGKLALAVACIVLLVISGVWKGMYRPSDESNAIGITENDSTYKEKIAQENQEIIEESTASSYKEVYEYLVKNQKSEENFYDVETNGVETSFDAATKNESATLESATTDSSTGNSYSQTNTQVEGIDEGDIIKNDGSYLYCGVTSGNQIRIIKIEGEKMKEVSSITLEGMLNEFYVQQDRLIVISSGANITSDTTTTEKEIDLMWWGTNESSVSIYDISKRESPKKIKTFEQDGEILSSRISNGYLYFFTQKYIEQEIEESSLHSYIPKVDGQYIKACDIVIPNAIEATSYLILSSINIENPNKVIATKAIVSGAYLFYVSETSIYTVENKWSTYLEGVEEDVSIEESTSEDTSEDTSTQELTDTVSSKVQGGKSSATILKYSYQEGKIHYVNTATIEGTVNDQFALDEYKKNLRVVATVTDTTKGDTTYNNLYVLDDKLKKVGEITKLAKDELIYSARYMGDTGYFVTFRQVDPLFSVDLSNPKEPKILGELKVTGFSSYLHFYSKDLLLGMGQEADEKDGAVTGVKLSMFDISNPKEVKEVSKTMIEGIDYAEFLYNYKSVIINSEKNLIGFSGYKDYEKNGIWYTKQQYYIYSYDPVKGFVQEMKLDCKIDQGNSYQVRGAFVGDILYVVCLNQGNAYWGGVTDENMTGKIMAYDMKSKKERNTIELK